MHTFRKYPPVHISNIPGSQLAILALDAFIDANIIGWECVQCKLCKRNVDYEHTPSDPVCPVGLACDLRAKLQVRRFRVMRDYSHCTYQAHYYRV